MKDRSKWAGIMEAWKSSGLTQTEFCKREGLGLSTFQNRKSELKRSIKSENFVEVRASKESAQLEIVSDYGVTVRVPLETPSERICELVQCLR